MLLFICVILSVHHRHFLLLLVNHNGMTGLCLFKVTLQLNCTCLNLKMPHHSTISISLLYFSIIKAAAITVSTYVHVCVAVCTYINVCGQAYMQIIGVCAVACTYIRVCVVVSPQRSDDSLPTDVPNSEGYIFIFNCFHVKSCA